jgi:hypothetical protein
MSLASVLVATMLLGTGEGMASQDSGSSVPLVRLKPADAEMRRLISDGFDRSATFRALVDAIHQSNGVVIVQYGLCANGRFRSCVTNVDGDRGRRSIRIKVNTQATDDRLIATIAHELHHAAEILSDPEVASPEAVLALYRRIGTGACRQGLSEACETDEALRVEAVVNDELARRARQ